MNQIQYVVGQVLPAHVRPFGFIFACRSIGDVSTGLIEIRHRINSDQYIQVYYLARGFAPSNMTNELAVFRDIRMKKTVAEGFYVRDPETGLTSTRPIPKIDPRTSELVLRWDLDDVTQKLTLEIIGEIIDAHLIYIRKMERKYPGRRGTAVAFVEAYPQIIQNKFDLTWEDAIHIIRP